MLSSVGLVYLALLDRYTYLCWTGILSSVGPVYLALSDRYLLHLKTDHCSMSSSYSEVYPVHHLPQNPSVLNEF